MDQFLNDPTSRNILIATVLAGCGLWLLLPRGGARGRMFGAVLAMAALGLYGAQIPRLGQWFADSVFLVLSLVTIVSAVATISFRNPVYCAIWFAMTLLGSSGLFLFQGAQFLAVATVVVYAGAILVTFLFVLMLANPKGRAYYDRVSWESLLTASIGAVMIGILTLQLAAVFQASDKAPRPVAPFTTAQLENEVLAPEHMAHLGRTMFSTHLISVEVAGTLLLVALVGAVAVLSQAHLTVRAPSRGEQRRDAALQRELETMRDG